MSTAPPFAYYGGKTNLARRIVDLLPPHGHHVEPFAGGLAVLLAKPRSAMATVNDIDGDLVLFWRVLRDQPDQLRRLMELTPHSRADYAAAGEVDGAPTTLERARRVWVLLSQGRGSGGGRGTGWRHHLDPAGSTVSMPGYLAGDARRVPACAHRLAGVSLECRDALDVIGDHGRHPDVLLYADPPYLGATRNGRRYRHEYASAAQHRRDLADALRRCAAAVVLSGYRSDLYADWHAVPLGAWTGNGIRGQSTQATASRVLWSNQPLGQPDLFNGGAT